jgi:molybdate transport system regulatory protein
MLKATYKIWLSKNDEKVFGQGPYELLRRVEGTNSLHQAAYQMNMSYNKAWRLIRLMEKRLGFPLLDKKIGGQSGGGSRVTLGAKEFMTTYERFQKEVEVGIEKSFQKHFGPIQKGKK